MSWLQKYPWLAFILVLLSYGIFGWHVAQASLDWSNWLIEQGKSWGWGFEEELAIGLLRLSGAVMIALFSIVLTAPIAFMTIFEESWFKSDVRAIISMLGWALLFVFMIRWFDYFVHFLVLLCATILGRLELQEFGYKRWQVSFILTSFCLGSFGLGVLTFSWWK